MTLRVVSPAKLNLFLAVGPKDGAGYHALRTVFQAIDLCDELTIETGGSGFSLDCDWPDLPQENTITKAWRLANEIALLPPLRVQLSKHIPCESGLGGGSSNAAAFLRSLPKLGVKMLPHEMEYIAAAVGADVPFFLVGGRALGEGYGEILTPQPDPEKEFFVIVRPNVSCPTGPMFAKLDQREFPFKAFPEKLLPYHNEFERVAPCESLELVEILLKLGASGAALTGSGSAVFGRFADEMEALRAKKLLEQQADICVWTAKSLDRASSLAIFPAKDL